MPNRSLAERIALNFPAPRHRPKDGSSACMNRIWVLLVFAIAALGFATNGGAADVPGSVPPPGSSDAVLHFLNQTIDWYHQVQSIDPSLTSSQELLLRSNVRENARQATKLAFQFARERRALIESSPTTQSRVHPRRWRPGGRNRRAHRAEHGGKCRRRRCTSAAISVANRAA